MSPLSKTPLVLALSLLATLPISGAVAPFATAEGVAVELVPEMETPPGILYQWSAERQALREVPAAATAEAVLRETTLGLWSDLRTLDVLELSRYQIEATDGWVLPEAPGDLVVETVGRDPETGELHVEVRGPRLPTRYQIVYRFLYLYGVVDGDTGELRRLVVTIRGWVEE